MEASSVRSRYAGRRPASARPVPGRGRRRNSRDSRLQRLITLQSLICVLLFFIVIIAKNINISAANFLTDQIRYALNHNIELKSILAYADNLAADIRNSIVPEPTEKPGVDRLAASGITPTSDPEALPASDPSSEETSNDVLNPVEKSVLSASTDYSIMPDMFLPVDGTLATPFGEISHDAAGSKIHAGIDIHAEKKSSVKAAMDGEVIETGSSPVYADYIKMRHDNGFETVYAYCRVLIVQKGDLVNKGDVIAQIGEQDISAGQHLHFEVWKDGEAVDPLEYISVAIR